MIINREIKNFLKLINAGWNALFESEECDGARSDMECDWLQFHWELLVEQRLRVDGKTIQLETYGDGAETNDGRIFPSERALYRVFCTSKLNESLKDVVSNKVVGTKESHFPVEFFATAQEGFYAFEAPFNSVLVYRSPEEEPLLLKIADLDFFIKELLVDGV